MVKPDDFNFELPENDEVFMEETSIVLKILKPAKTKIVKDIFENADFWMSKGVLLQTKRSFGDK